MQGQPNPQPSEGLAIEWVPVDSIRPCPTNPRVNHTAIPKVAESIEAFGWRQPIVTDKSGEIIVGHTRWAAAKALGLEQIPVHKADLAPAEVRQYRIADNRTGEEATWDLPMLKAEMADLKRIDPTLIKPLGFNGREATALLRPPPKPAGNGEADPYGGATGVRRGSAPMRHWASAGLLSGDVLDFGAGNDAHEFAKYDMATYPDVSVLTRRWDTVICNYVLNVQPSEHLIDILAALLLNLLRGPESRALIALAVEKHLSGTAAAGWQEVKSRQAWAAILGRFFKLEKCKNVGFCGFIGHPHD